MDPGWSLYKKQEVNSKFKMVMYTVKMAQVKIPQAVAGKALKVKLPESSGKIFLSYCLLAASTGNPWRFT